MDAFINTKENRCGIPIFGYKESEDNELQTMEKEI